LRFSFFEYVADLRFFFILRVADGRVLKTPSKEDSKATLSGSGADVSTSEDVVVSVTSELVKFPAHLTYGIKDEPKVRMLVLKSEAVKESGDEKEDVVESTVQKDAEALKGPETNKEKDVKVDTTVQKDTIIPKNSYINKENKKLKQD